MLEPQFGTPSTYVELAKKHIMKARKEKQAAQVDFDAATLYPERDEITAEAKLHEAAALWNRRAAREALVNYDNAVRRMWALGVHIPRLKDALNGKDFRNWSEWQVLFGGCSPVEDIW